MSTPALGSEKAEMGQGGGAESWGTQRGRAQMGEQLGESRRERLMTRKGRKGWRVRSWVRPHSGTVLQRASRRQLCQQSGLTAAFPLIFRSFWRPGALHCATPPLVTVTSQY